jgi:hypothetical protein
MTHAVNAALTSGNANEIEALKNDLDAANNLHGSDICEDEVRTAATGRFPRVRAPDGPSLVQELV